MDPGFCNNALALCLWTIYFKAKSYRRVIGSTAYKHSLFFITFLINCIMKYPQTVHIPSAVSEWLEEQLEARGIESVLYTRYILSLLRAHTVSVVCPEDEEVQLVQLNKEVKRTNGRKRFRRSSGDWWRLSQADAEQLKRSAAIECLISASDQNYEIESLVDELCEKLKLASTATDSVSCSSDSDTSPPKPSLLGKRVTRRELAERYYAAFPALGRGTTDAAGASTVAIVGQPPQVQGWKRIASAIGVDKDKLVAGRSGTLSHCWKNKIRGKAVMDSYNPRHGDHSSKQHPHIHQQCTKSRPARKSSWDHNNSLTKKPKQSHYHTNQIKTIDDKCTKKQKHENDQCLEDQVTKNEWSNEDNFNMYDDLPVDISELLDSPSPPEDNTVEIMNMKNVRDTGNRNFIPYGTNMSSIWSTDSSTTLDNIFNAALDANGSNEKSLNLQFSSISINNCWPNINDDQNTYENVENEINSFFEKENSTFFGQNERWSDRWNLETFSSLPVDWDKDDEVENEGFEDKKLLHQVAISLMKINHNKEKSCFKEVVPRGSNAPKNSPVINPHVQSNIDSMFSFMKSSLEKDDLLTSERSHFKPIIERVENRMQGQYADGATFIISNSLDKVDYKRSDSGAMILEMEYGQSKKYREYKPDDLATTPSPDVEFVLKFSICQNDKACQTENGEQTGCYTNSTGIQTDCLSTGQSSTSMSSTSIITSTPPSSCDEETSNCTCLADSYRPDSSLREVVWKYENGCTRWRNNNNVWTQWGGGEEGSKRDGDGRAVEWNSERLRDIWDGQDVCQDCLNKTTSNTTSTKTSEETPPPPNSRLREDISQDGEQLLLDLRHLQKTYMEELPSQAVEDILAENEKKLQTGSSYFGGVGFGNSGGLWSFASRLEEDCMIQMSTIPTLRSVTL